VKAAAASFAVSSALRALSATWRAEFVDDRYYRELLAAREPFVIPLWHGRMLLPIWYYRHEAMATMASRSGDGAIIARFLEKNGFLVARGSTSHGGGRALAQILDWMRAGHPAAVTVDGPKGPPRVVQSGIVSLLRKTNGWVLPITGSASRPRFLKSWDRYLVPKAFSRTVVVIAQPFRVIGESDEEAAAHIGRELDRITAEADRRAGITPPPPWSS
jgi:lysophospholipid acyltransferase (LPLAT)-like uncharacterized protein